MKNVLLLLLLFFLLSWIGGCIPPKALFLGAPDPKDPNRFPRHLIEKSEKPFSFHKGKTKNLGALKVNDWTSDLPVFSSIQEVVSAHNNNAFLIIRNDSILFEYYAEGKGEQELHTSYSIAKSFTSALFGIALEEGAIKDINASITDYFPELAGQKYFDQLTLAHLLNHTSGIKNTLMMDAQIYYGRDLSKGIEQIEFNYPPGKKQQYVNINSQLLGMVISQAVGRPVSDYLEEKLWQPLGMESDAYWNTDELGEQVKSYCCLNATAKDYAKFGRLFMREGNWNGQQLISADWVQKSLARDTTQGSSHGYNHAWHIGLKEYGDFMAVGLYKQYLYVCPKKNIIIVSLNNKEKKIEAERVNWPYIFRQLVDVL